jgi:hypothetical protein
MPGWIQDSRDRLRTADSPDEMQRAFRDALDVAEAVALRLSRSHEVADPVACLTAADAAAEARDRLSELTRTRLTARPRTPQDADDPTRLAEVLSAIGSEIMTALGRMDGTAENPDAELARSWTALAAEQLVNCVRGDRGRHVR